jgi:hypothetical protein
MPSYIVMLGRQILGAIKKVTIWGKATVKSKVVTPVIHTVSAIRVGTSAR